MLSPIDSQFLNIKETIIYEKQFSKISEFNIAVTLVKSEIITKHLNFPQTDQAKINYRNCLKST